MRLLSLTREVSLFSLCTLALYLVYTFSFKVSFTPDIAKVKHSEFENNPESAVTEDLANELMIKMSPTRTISIRNISTVNVTHMPDAVKVVTPLKLEIGISGYDAVPRLVSSKERSAAQPILTLFTTFKQTPDRINIQTNTILNWAALGTLVQPLAFANLSLDEILVKRAREHGWIVMPLLRTNKYGTPFLKDMYRAVPRLSNSTFYGFCNADILFEEGLVKTMVAMKHYAEDFNSTLVIGRRKNVNIDPSSAVPLYKASEIVPLAKTKGKLFRTDAEDYFMIGSVNRFPWHMIKDVVIGRPGYDNYLVGQALKGNVSVVDVTSTVLAFHQTGKDGIHAGAHNKDGHYNHHMIGRYHYNSGLTSSARYVSVLDFRGDVFLKRRGRP